MITKHPRQIRRQIPSGSCIPLAPAVIPTRARRL